MQEGKFPAAEDELKEALKKDAGLSGAYIMLGKLYTEEANQAQAKLEDPSIPQQLKIHGNDEISKYLIKAMLIYDQGRKAHPANIEIAALYDSNLERLSPYSEMEFREREALLAANRKDDARREASNRKLGVGEKQKKECPVLYESMKYFQSGGTQALVQATGVRKTLAAQNGIVEEWKSYNCDAWYSRVMQGQE